MTAHNKDTGLTGFSLVTVAKLLGHRGAKCADNASPNNQAALTICCVEWLRRQGYRCYDARIEVGTAEVTP